jgi:aspartate 1-decarboxylase
MTRNMLKSKIHRATVTDADLNYDGSITVDAGLMEAANMLPHELVHVWNVNNGERFETYVIPGPRQSGTICVNGSAARRVHRGDLLIIASFTWLAEEEALRHEPAVVLVDEQNHIRKRNGVSVEAA